MMRALQRAADEIVPLQREHGDAEHLAAAHNFTIGADGSLTDHGPGPDVPAEQVAAVQAERGQVRAELIDTIRRILERADDIDVELAAILDRAEQGEIVDARQGDPARLEPPRGAEPEEVHRWWTGLSEAEQAQVLEANPQWVGATDGIPAEARDTANRIVLAEQKQQLIDRSEELQQRLDDTPFSRFGSQEQRHLRDQIAEIESKLGGINAIEDRLASTANAPDDQRHYLLGIDTAGNGQAIIAKGNPDTAEHTATYVPGTGAGLDGIGELMNRGEDMQREAAFHGTGSTSVIT
ncbi:hypothetical protein [Haloechinothrix sp. LS1_15]|uniref:hypothetical protein n=1 Tax=Haloechinothrix sp. LS1_15 TaxID=2652248 RepID=UPI00294567A3|nr:hypothetical protein [Haloechinothrix sp. LS1_15]MDV6013734.1 hypothetical protein [Haloechinothrix sp. LS1_15]